MKHFRTYFLLSLLLLVWCDSSLAQWQVQKSVLSEGTWYKIGVTSDGVYGIGVSDLQALGVALDEINPENICMFGNRSSVLPEANSEERYDDLTELAIKVTGTADGRFDAGDSIFFYGSGPLELTLTSLDYYQCRRHPYTDTVYYFLRLDGDVPGLRIQENDFVGTASDAPVVSTFPDVIFYENEELSPYASGRTWYGDMFSLQEGHKDFDYDITDLDKSNVLRVNSRVMGRSKTRFSYNLRIGNNLIIDHEAIPAYVDHEYGKEREGGGMFFVDNDHITVRYELNPVEANPLLFIDCFYLNFWRKLVFHGKELPFRFMPSQLSLSEEVRVQLQGVSRHVVCWEVTDPLRPASQPLGWNGTMAYYGITGSQERRYHLFDGSGVKPVASSYPITNQNLHSLTDAEMLIITPRVFHAPSEELAAFHREQDGLDCMVVDVEEVFNEFGTGIRDITAIRDFIRMMYLRSQGNLKYVLFMGKGTHDYRDLKGIGNNFIPTYEMEAYPCNEVNSMCSDDYFALMDLSEGLNCEGMVDLGLGRLPVTTVAQAEQMVEKIRHYADITATHGIWKSLHLLMSDNDSKTYVNHTETLDRILDTACNAITTQKLYIDSYPLVSTPTGQTCPGAHDALLDYFVHGFGLMSYTGHGGVKGLTSEVVLSVSDILSMDNYDRLPFVHTATCEFSKFDNPSVVSGGELMALNPQGGAIAMLTTLRPTLAQNNQMLSMAFHECVYDQVEGQSLRFGDIFRIAKSNSKYYRKSNIVYVLFGDPALRFMHPSNQVRAVTVNGMDAMQDNQITVSEMINVEGVVTNDQGIVDTLFNGVLQIRLFDQKSQYTTLGNLDIQQNYSFFHDVLFDGEVSVYQGRFTGQMPIPSELGYGNGNARIVFYAYDSIRKADALGVLDGIVLTSSQVVDDAGPEIQFYWNDPSFQNGDNVSRKGTLYAELYDEYGIYHYNYSLGRDIILKSNIQKYNNIIINDYFEPSLDDYRRGRIVFPVDELEEGMVEFSLKAWDTQNNASEVSIFMQVEMDRQLDQICNFPNPFKDETSFSFVNGDLDESLSVIIEVYDLMGRQVAMLQEETASTMGVVPAIRWDGRSSKGQELRAGVYVYRMSIKTADGNVRTITRRMVKY